MDSSLYEWSPWTNLRRLIVAIGTVAALMCVGLRPTEVTAQSFQGSTASTMGGIALGTYSGAMLGLVGSVLPCNRTVFGSKCAATGASVGGALGIAMGGLVGAQNQDQIIARLEGAGLGALIGVGVGIGLRRAIRQYDWEDVATVAALGAAYGAAPVGSGIGAGVGATTGAIVWLAFPRAGIQDFILFTLAGSALGGMVDWANGAATAKQDSGPQFTPSFSISVR